MSVSNATLRGCKCSFPTQLSSKAAVTENCCFLTRSPPVPMCSRCNIFLASSCRMCNPVSVPFKHSWTKFILSFNGDNDDDDYDNDDDNSLSPCSRALLQKLLALSWSRNSPPFRIRKFITLFTTSSHQSLF